MASVPSQLQEEVSEQQADYSFQDYVSTSMIKASESFDAHYMFEDANPDYVNWPFANVGNDTLAPNTGSKNEADVEPTDE